MVKKDHYDQIDNSNNQYAKLKKFRICNHAIALLSTRGHHSPRNKGKPPTALCFDTAFCMYLFYHFSIKKQSNVRYISCKKNNEGKPFLLFFISLEMKKGNEITDSYISSLYPAYSSLVSSLCNQQDCQNDRNLH